MVQIVKREAQADMVRNGFHTPPHTPTGIRRHPKGIWATLCRPSHPRLYLLLHLPTPPRSPPTDPVCDRSRSPVSVRTHTHTPTHIHTPHAQRWDHRPATRSVYLTTDCGQLCHTPPSMHFSARANNSSNQIQLARL
jgi:hypothetical protein